MTFKQNILRHWWKLLIATTVAPLPLLFGYVNPEQLISGYPLKYVAVPIAALGVYTVVTVRTALRGPTKAQPQPIRTAPTQSQGPTDEDIWPKFGDQQQ